MGIWNQPINEKFIGQTVALAMINSLDIISIDFELNIKGVDFRNFNVAQRYLANGSGMKKLCCVF